VAAWLQREILRTSITEQAENLYLSKTPSVL